MEPRLAQDLPSRREPSPARRAAGKRGDEALKAALTRQVRAAGLLAPAVGWYRRRVALLLLLFAGSFAGLLRVRPGAIWVGLVIATGVLAVQLGTLSHDASHHAVDRRRWVNELCGHLGMTLVTGLSFTHFRLQHDDHHRYCQDEERDPDMQYGLILAVYPRAADSRRGIARLLLPWQSAYFWLVAVVAYTHSLRLQSLLTAWRQPRARVDRLVLPLHYLLWLGLPSLVVGPLAALLGYLATSLVIGAVLTALFSVNHMGMPSLGSGERPSYLRQQVEGSRNVDLWGPVGALFGGLHYQIEHHLFPSIGQPRLGETRRIVEPFCRANGIAYQSVGFFAAQREIHRHLATIGRLARPAGAARATRAA